MKINIKNLTRENGFNIAKFSSKKNAEKALKSTFGFRPIAIKAEMAFGYWCWVVVDSVDSQCNVRMIKFLGDDNVFRTHSHPGYISGDKKICV